MTEAHIWWKILRVLEAENLQRLGSRESDVICSLASNCSRVEEKMTSKTHWFKNAMRMYAAELICSTGVLGFQIFKLVFTYIISE